MKLRPALLAALLSLWGAAPGLGQGLGLASPEQYEALSHCLAEARAGGRDVGVCKGQVTCASRQADRSEAYNAALCALEEEWVWSALAIRTGQQIIDAGPERSGYTQEEFLAALSERQETARQICTEFPVGKEHLRGDCLLEASIDELRWMYAILDAMPAQ